MLLKTIGFIKMKQFIRDSFCKKKKNHKYLHSNRIIKIMIKIFKASALWDHGIAAMRASLVKARKLPV